MRDKNLASVFAQLRAELGGDGAASDEDNALAITFENGCEVVITSDEEAARIVIESDLGPWPGAEQRLLRLLLKNNYPWADTAQQFSLRPTDDNLIAARCLDARTVALDDLKEAIAGLAHSVASWKHLLASSQNDDASRETDHDAMPPNSIRI